MNELEKIFLAFHVNGTYEFALDYVLFRNYKYFMFPITGNRYRFFGCSYGGEMGE